MTILRNPYVAGNPVGNSPAFIGREAVLREVLRVLRRPQDNAIVLYGQRRIGKTSILQHLATRLPEEGPYRPVYLDLQDKAAWPLGRLLQDMACVIAHALGQPEPDLGPDPETAFREEWLPTTLDSLQNETAVVLLLDEFDVLSDPKAEQAAAAFFPYLRGLLACDPDRLQFEFVIGRNVDDLSSIALSVFKGTPARHISLLSREDTANLVRLSEANNTLRWPDEAVEQVWEWTHGHPFLTQQLCSHVWERAYDEASLDEQPDETPVVAPAQVGAAVIDALDASKNTMEWLWDGLPPAARVVASALAEAGSDAISPEALERLLYDSGVRVVIRELQSAPQLLQDWDLIEPADGGYRFRVELLRRWIAENKPLRRVQEELDHIEPVAENLYQAAQGLYQGGQLEQTVSLLRQAIALNPNHVRANQLLADMLLTQGNASEATQLLEQLYEYQPAAARPRLVQALLGQAKEAATVDDRLDLYEQVLAFDPAQPEAATGKRRIWEQRGDAALEAGDMATALEAYSMGDASRKTWERCGDAAMEAGDLETALEAYQRAGASDRAGEVAEELERRQRLKDLYQRALGALQSDDRQTAQSLLVEVISLEPGYEDATHYLHLAVTGSEVSEPRAEWSAVRQTVALLLRQLWVPGPWSALVLTVVHWLVYGTAAYTIWSEVGGEPLGMATIGTLGGAINGLILGVALHWTEALPRRVRLPALGVGFGLVAMITQGLPPLALRDPYDYYGDWALPITALVMTVVSAVFSFWRPERLLLARRQEAEKKPLAPERAAPQRVLPPWNPRVHLPLLWWLLMRPQELETRMEVLRPLDLPKVGKWLVSTLVWLPLFLTLVTASGGEVWLWALKIGVMGTGLLLGWVLTGRLGDRDGKWWPWAAGTAAFIVVALAGHLMFRFSWMGYEVHAAGTLSICIALGVARTVDARTAAGIAAGVLAGMVVGSIPEIWILVGALFGVPLALLLPRQLKASLQTGHASSLAVGTFVVLLLCYVLMLVLDVVLLLALLL